MNKKKMREIAEKKIKRISKVSVKNLFGMFNHTIPLNLDDRITIVHSPNGFGKTIILKLLDEMFSQQTLALRTTPFEEFRIDFDDGTSFWVTPTDHSSQENEEEEYLTLSSITFHATDRPLFTMRYSLSPSTVSFRQLSLDDLFYNEKAAEYQEELVLRWGRSGPGVVQEREPEWLVEMRQSISIRLIATQRLLNLRVAKQRSSRLSEQQPAISTVTMYSTELAKTIQTKLAESASLSQSLDRTFPERVFASQNYMGEEEISRRLAELDEKRARLMSTGLLEQEGSSFQLQSGEQVDESKKIMLSVYIEDTEKKLKVFDELARKIELLTTIINNRFLYKRMTIDKVQGFVFTARNNTMLSLESLSSGEQHELVLFYELLFKVAPGSLILIDEPEISLHVIWQEQFLKDVQAVTKMTDTDVLIATHSPDIIDDRRDLMVELRGPENGEL